MSKSELKLEREIERILAESDRGHERAGAAMSPVERIIVENLSSRAYNAMAAAEQRFGHSSPEHRVAWTVFSDAQSILRGDDVPLAFSGNAERSNALGLVEARCADKRGLRTQGIAEEIVRMTRNPRFMGQALASEDEAEREVRVDGGSRSRPVAPRETKQPRPRGLPRPYVAQDSKVVVPSRSGHEFTMVLRPAKLRRARINGREGKVVTPAKRSDEVWLVMTKWGRYMGVLQEGGGREPWAVSRLEEETGSIGKDGARVRDSILTGVTWQDAVALGAQAWWAP